MFYTECTFLLTLYIIFLFYYRGAYRYLKLLFVVYMYQKRNITVAKAFATTVAKHRTKTCLIFEDTSWSFQDLEDYSNRVGNYFLKLGFKVKTKIFQSNFRRTSFLIIEMCIQISYLWINHIISAWRLCCIVHGKPSRIRRAVAWIVQGWHCSCAY